MEVPGETKNRDFPCGPVVGSLPSSAGNAGSNPGWGAGKQCCSEFNGDFKKNGPPQKNFKKNKKLKIELL